MFRIASTGGIRRFVRMASPQPEPFCVRAKRIRQLHLPRAEALGLQKTKAANHNHCRLSARCGNLTRSVSSRRTTGSCQLRHFSYSASIFFVSLLLHNSDGFRRNGSIAPLEPQEAESASLKQIIGARSRCGTHADFASQRAGDQIFQRGFAPSRHYLGLPEKIIGQIQRRFHMGHYMALR